MPIKLVLFDALHTIVTPRYPISRQYANAFLPYLGVIDETRVSIEFPKALKHMQMTKPAYEGGKDRWWAEVVRQTAIQSGADINLVEANISKIMVTLMEAFGTEEGYKLFDDVEETLQGLEFRGVRIGLVSNTDTRMRRVLEDLGIAHQLYPIVLSGEEGIEKPSPKIWELALQRSGHNFGEVVHVGDELEADYLGAKNAGLNSLLLLRNRPAEDVDEPIVVNGQVLDRDTMIRDLPQLLRFVDRRSKK